MKLNVKKTRINAVRNVKLSSVMSKIAKEIKSGARGSAPANEMTAASENTKKLRRTTLKSMAT
jgi:hypothetical protein